jgi:hypothetical protein
MFIRTEYRGQRYSMGSSDPLPTRFEIRFGGLNFQATGNGYLMRLTNREELRARRQAGSSPVATARAATTPATGAVGTPACSARRLAMRRAHQHDDSRPGGGALGLWTTLPYRAARRHDSICRLCQHQ